MKRKKILKSVKNNEISLDQGYELLFGSKKRIRNAHFVRLKIKTGEGKAADRLVNFLFLLPFPLVLVKPFLSKSDLFDGDLPKKDLMKLICQRGIRIEIKSSNKEKILIKTI